MIPMRSVEAASELLRAAKSLFVLTGAGASAESGVPTFREAQTGYWSRFDPETLASQRGFAADPGLVWRWYMERLRGLESARPNPGHTALARLEPLYGGNLALFTQNVDDLHERAGSTAVYHLHGSITRFRCNECFALHQLAPAERGADLPPHCALCGNWVRPDVVWFGEMLPSEILELGMQKARSCDVALVVGTSGVVYPAADLPYVARGAGHPVIEVNPEPTPISELADVVLSGPGGELLPRLVDLLDATRRP